MSMFQPQCGLPDVMGLVHGQRAVLLHQLVKVDPLDAFHREEMAVVVVAGVKS